MSISTHIIYDELLEKFLRETSSFKHNTAPPLSNPQSFGNKEVTVYIPCFNASYYLPEVIQSILSQTYPIKEILLIDDGSTDNSVEVASKFPVKIIKHNNNFGLSAARNTAIQNTTTEFIAAIDSDTAPDNLWLERILEGFSESNIAGVGGRLFEANSLLIPDRWRTRMMPQHYGNTAQLDIKPFGCNSVYRTQILKDVGGYNESFRAAYDDMDIAERVLKAGFHTYYVPHAICRHLRRDSLESVISSCYNWRKPGYEIADAYIDHTRLTAKWVFGSKCDSFDLITLCKEGNQDLSFISLILIFSTFIKDLFFFYSLNPCEERLLFISDGILLLLLVLYRLTNLTNEEQIYIHDQISKLISTTELEEIEYSIPFVLPKLLPFNRSNNSLEDVFKKAEIALNEQGTFLAIGLSEVLKNLSFDDFTWNSLHESFHKIQNEALNASQELFLVANLSMLSINHFKYDNKDSAKIYTPILSSCSVQQFIETICGCNAKTVTFLCIEEEIETTQFLAELCKKRTSIEVNIKTFQAC
jgi:glycosyltransferase involved in cell wall biosynthesis